MSLKQVTNKTNKVALKVVRAAEGSARNLVIYPLCLQIGLSMLHAGAAKSARSGIAKSMGFHKNSAVVFEELKFIIENIKDPTLIMASTVFVDQSLNVKDEFRDFIKRYYGTDVVQIPLSTNVNDSANKINRWVYEKTNKKVSDVVDSKDIEQAVSLILVTAVHFKGKWLEEFKSRFTRKEDFFVDKKTVVKVNMMYNKSTFSFGNVYDIRSSVLQLFYAAYKFCLILILPFEIEGLKDVEQKMSSKSISSILKKLSSTEVEVKLPKLKIESTNEMNQALMKMGAKEIFKEKANFDHLVGTSVKVSKVIHKASIELDEEGRAEPSKSSTSIHAGKKSTHELLSSSGKIPRFVANHPFMMFLCTGEDPPIILCKANIVKIE